MAPIHLSRLLEIYTSHANETCPHVVGSTGTCVPLTELTEWGFIEEDPIAGPDDHGYQITDKGKVYVEAVLDTPFPQWAVVVGER